MFISPTLLLILTLVLTLALSSSQCMITVLWVRSDRRLKATSDELALVCLDRTELIDELKWRRKRDENVSRQLADLAKDLVNAQRAIVAIHGPDLLTPERRAIITAASLIDKAKRPLEEKWVSSTST